MWVPGSAEEIEGAARRGELPETTTFDAKADLPQPKKNVDVAVDVASMSTDGGVLLYGVAEDVHKRPTIPSPMPLAGAADRIAHIVQTSIAEVPYIDVREYPTDDDPSKGYIVVIVPQSARAPHQVTVGGNLRFYGRGAKGNRILTEGDVARLYRRREEWEQNRDDLLAWAVSNPPYPTEPDVGYVHAFARPVAPDRSIWHRAVESAGDRAALQVALQQAAAKPGPHTGFGPNLKSHPHWRRDGADAWRLSSHHDVTPQNTRYVVTVTVNMDGRGNLFCGRATERIDPRGVAAEPERLIIFESVIAGNFAAFLAVMGALNRASDYHGHVDVGLAVSGLEGGYSSTLLQRMAPFLDREPFSGKSYWRHERLAAAELDAPEAITRHLLHELFEATTGREDFDPFE